MDTWKQTFGVIALIIGPLSLLYGVFLASTRFHGTAWLQMSPLVIAEAILSVIGVVFVWPKKKKKVASWV